MGLAPTVASALEGFGILAYAGLVFLVVRLAARWADRALSADGSIASPPNGPRPAKGD